MSFAFQALTVVLLAYFIGLCIGYWLGRHTQNT